MALTRQALPIPIDGGLETKLDPKQEQIGYFRKMENVVFETVKQLRKRNGYDGITLKDGDGAAITAAKALARFKEELVLMTESKLYSFSNSIERFIERGKLYNVKTEEDFVYKDTGSQNDVDGLSVENLRIYAWEDDAGGIFYSVQDLDEDNFIVSGTEVNATGENPVLANVGSTVFIIFGDGADVKFVKFSTTEPTNLSSETTVISNRDLSDGLIDAEPCDTKVIVAYNASTDLSIFSIDSTGATSSILGVTGENASEALDIFCDSPERIVVTYSDGTAVKTTIYPFTLISTPLLAPTTIEAIADVKTCCALEITDGSYRMYYEVEQAGDSNNYVKQADITIAGAVSGVAVFKRSVGLSARAFLRSDSAYIPVVHESPLQSTYFLLDSDGAVVTKWSNQTAGGVIDFGVLPQFNSLSDDKYFTSFLVRNRLRGDNGTFFTTKGIASVIIDFDPSDMFSNAELSNGLHICSGILRLFDGSTVSEHGFHLFPETLTQDSTATTGGAMSDGSYGYLAVYRWTDNFGQEHRSAPTQAALTTVLSGGTSTQTNTITIPTLRITDKVDPVIELYRTEDAGTTYYQVTDPLSPLANDSSVDTVNFVDTLSDTDLIDNELLYTTGGVIENIAAPACSEVVVFGSRLAVVNEGSNRVFFSKEIGEATPVEFTDIIYRDVDPLGGPITALKAMDDKLIIFESDACFYLTGDGPNNLGQQDTFTKPEIITTDIGCTSSKSVILTPMGLMFQSRKGIWMVDGGMRVTYRGARAEGFNAQTVTSAQIVGELNQVRFLLDTDRALVYNYNLDRWATFENHGGKSSVTILNDYYYIREDGSLFKENRTSYSDNSSSIKMRLESGWMNVAGLQNFQRVYQLMVLAAYKSSHKLRIKFAYNFEEAWVQEEIVDPTNFMTPSAYGDDSPYGAGTPYGGDGLEYQFKLHLTIQKCQSIKVCIEDLQSEPGEGLALSGLNFKVGVKEGANKVGDSQDFGTDE